MQASRVRVGRAAPPHRLPRSRRRRHHHRSRHRGRRRHRAGRAGDHPRRRRVRRHDVDPFVPAGAQPGDGVRRAPRAARAPSSTPSASTRSSRRSNAAASAYGAGHEVDEHDWAVAPPEAGTGSAGLGRPRSRGAGGAVVRRWARLLVLLAGGALGRRRASSSPTRARPWAALALIGGAIAAGELIELRPPLRAAAPDLVRVHGRARRARRRSQDAALVLVVACSRRFLVRSEPTSVEGRLALFVERLVEGLGRGARVPRSCPTRSATRRPRRRVALRARRRGRRADR